MIPEYFNHVRPLGWTSSLLRHLINCFLRLEENSPLLLFPGVNELRREMLPQAPQDCAVVWGGLAHPPPWSDISNIAVFEVLGWAPALSALMRDSCCLFNSGSPSVSSCFCICIPNKQEIVFICMQMCLSPRLRFWIKSFTVPLIPNYTRALTWAPLLSRGLSDFPSKRISVSLGCSVLPSVIQT